MRFGRWIQTFWRNLLAPSSRYKSSFLLTLKMEMPGSTKMLVPVCQTPPHHIPWTHNLNTFYTENTDFACILLAFIAAQHDSLAEIGPQLSCVMQESWPFLNSWYKRIMKHRGLKFGIFIPMGSTSLENFCEVWMYVGICTFCVNLVWIYKLCKHQLYTHCVYCWHCVPKVQ